MSENNILKEIHEYELDAFRCFIQICETYKLEYYAIGGTLLGAVRHNGFIPWDDDIDVAMPRESYDKFLEIAPSCLPEHLVMDEPWTNPNFLSYFAKIRNKNIELHEALEDNNATTRIGYLIDIIPLDGTPNNLFFRQLYYIKTLYYRFLCGAANVHTGIRTNRPKRERMLLSFCKKLKLYEKIDIHKVYLSMDKLFKKQDYKNSLYAGTITGAYNIREIVPKEYFGDYHEATEFLFEDLTIKGPALIQEYLTHIYGEDYMIPPPARARRPHYQAIIIKKDQVEEKEDQAWEKEEGK